MANHIGNYAKHARFWDWGGHDRTPEHNYWHIQAKKYGKNILIPMCALGETGAYMAQRGMNVTALDITPEMIAESKKRFGDIPNLHFHEADITCFNLSTPPADFCFCVDLQHIPTIENINKALICIKNHLRDGGGLIIETGIRLPGAKSTHTPAQTWHPQKQVYPNMKVWKTGETRYDAETGRNYISQTFYAEDANGNIDSFAHEFYLQNYYRHEWLDAFKACGYEIIGEYINREHEPWQGGNEGFRIFEAVKIT